MSSIQGFRCAHCRAEFLTTLEPGTFNRPGSTPPVLCCGQPLRLLDTGQVLSVPPVPRRIACCPRCGYQMRLVIQPTEPLVCMVCQTDFVILGGHAIRHEPEIAVSGSSRISH